MKVKVNSQGTKIVAVNTQGTTEVVSVGIQGPQGAQGAPGIDTSRAIGDLTDVDVTNLQNGSILVYSVGNNMWTSTTTLSAQNMEGGEY